MESDGPLFQAVGLGTLFQTDVDAGSSSSLLWKRVKGSDLERPTGAEQRTILLLSTDFGRQDEQNTGILTWPVDYLDSHWMAPDFLS